LGRGASTNSIPEIENDRFLLVIGSNTTEAHPVLALRIKKAVRNGATLVVADPRKIWLTKIAKRHLQLRPGTDVWLINAIMHTILEEGLQDEAFIREFTEDFDAVREVVSRYTPEEAEVVTGVPASAIRATAREYATERHAGIFYTLGITEHACGVDNIWSLSNLVLMTGHLGYESTGLNALRGQNNVQGLNDSGANPAYFPGYQPADDPEIVAKFESAWGVKLPTTPGYRLDQMISGLHDGRIKALYLIGENPAQTEPNAHHVEEGLGKLDFLISQDLFLNETSRDHANVVFPASSFAEKDGTFTNTERRVNLVRPGVHPPGNARVDREIVIDMARHLGADWPDYPDASAVWDELADLSPNWYGIRHHRLQKDGIQWPCPDLDHPGTRFLHAPRPARASGKGKFFPVEYQPPIEQPDSEYPLVLSTGRTLYHYNSATMTMREGGITDKQEDPFFEISPEDASNLGLADGDWARIVSRRGDLEARAHVGDRVYPGLVWMALHFTQARVNWLTHDVGDSLIGTPEYKVSAVRVERLASPGGNGDRLAATHRSRP
jgi:formate dehydrogenase major subunit/formate dehydrogenase alpha subunit